MPEVDIAGFVAEASSHSDMARPSLRRLAEQVVLAYQRQTDPLPALEIGTRRGGSALLILRILKAMFPNNPPVLLTVDPYGGKLYRGGDLEITGLYGDKDYVAAKELLAPFPNHAHFLMRGLEMLRSLRGFVLWRHGQPMPMTKLGFVLLDGEHDHSTIGSELEALLNTTTSLSSWMSDGSIILVDNTDKDRMTVQTINDVLYRNLVGYERSEVVFHDGDTPGAGQAVIRVLGPVEP